MKDYNPIGRLELELKMQRVKHKSLLRDYGSQFEDLNYRKKSAYLKNENKELCQELKRLNLLITDLILSKETCILYYNI